MIDKFLKAKHWMIFTPLVGIPLLFQIILMSTLMAQRGPANFDDFSIIFLLLPFMILLNIFIYFGWMWSVVEGLKHRLAENVSLKIKLFKRLLLVPVIYMTLLSIVLFSLFALRFDVNGSALLGVMIGLGVFAHLFSIFCMFHSFYFVAKLLKSIEQKKEAQFMDFIGEFCLIWFFPIGVWILQPRINRLAAGDELNPLGQKKPIVYTTREEDEVI